MGVKIVVREDEPFARALARFKKQMVLFNVGKKWPYDRTFYAPAQRGKEPRTVDKTDSLKGGKASEQA